MSAGPSLRRKLLAWLLPASLLLLVAGAVTAYSVALRTASRAYDRVLLDTAADISDQVQAGQGAPTIDLSPVLQKILLKDRYDHFYYQVSGPAGEFVGGDRDLPLPAEEPTPDGTFYDVIYRGEHLRAVAWATQRTGTALRIVVAESLVKRKALIREIWLGVLVPESLLLILTCGLLLIGIRHGLAPLAGLARELSYRSHLDLSKVEDAHAPEEVKPLVNEINHLLQRLDASQQSQRAFISNAAHQIRTPIAALQAQVELALRQPGDRKPAENLKLVLAAAQRIAHVSNQVLSLARSETAGDARHEFQAVDLHAVAKDVGETWIASAIEKDIDLGFELDHAAIDGSPALLRELLGNLVHNAITYTQAGGRITVRVRRESRAVALEVEDNGPGIPAEELGRIFERFYRPVGSAEGGCGLGLAIVDEIARRHHAEVAITAPAGGQGTLVSVRFPPPPPATGAGQPAPDR